MTQKQQQFLVLRANGNTFDNIATELKVTKQTLLNWSKIYEDEINDLKYLAMLELKEKYRYSQKTKYETLLKQIEKVDDAILKKDLSKASLKDLMMFKNDLLENINYMELDTNFINTGLDEVSDFNFSMTKKQTVNIDKAII
jgi:transcriptional regulator